jgi:hypothetical protein
MTVIPHEGGGGGASSDAAVIANDAGSDAGPRIEWLRQISASSSAQDEELALGPPDGRCAVLRNNGKILFELSPGIPTATAGTPGADLEVVVRGDGPYLVDVETDRHSTSGTNIGTSIVGSTPLDVDQFDVHEFRYVRVKNTTRTATVCVDAVGVYVDRPAP